MIVDMFSEYVRASNLSENNVDREFNDSKRHVLKVLKAYVYKEMRGDIESRESSIKENG